MLPDEIAKARQGPVGHFDIILSLLSPANETATHSQRTTGPRVRCAVVSCFALRNGNLPDAATTNAISIAYGGGAPTVIRLPRTEAFLAGKSATLDTFEHAGRIARVEIKPISDVRGSADRLQVAENITAKFWYEVFGETAAPRRRK